MKFKVDENLPIELVEILREHQYDTTSVIQQGLQGETDSSLAKFCQRGQLVLVTLDSGFSDIRTYPPWQFSGLIVLSLKRQDKKNVIQTFTRVIPLIQKQPLEGHLWIVEETRVRIRGKE